MNNLDIDQTVDYVKNLIDNIRCALCDKLDGCRMRYSCGHAVCDNCFMNSEDCLICLSPPQTSNAQAKQDNALTQRVKNASVLLKACQDLFNTDVLQRKRISEQLRIEKELFPKCIQAPVKYENKRKSKVLSKSNKENRISKLFPGEETSPCKEDIMENSVSYVQKWLNKNDKEFYRKPFQDLNVNIQSGNNTGLCKKRNTIKELKDKELPVLMKNRKRSHFKTTVKNIPLLDKSRNSLRKYNVTPKRLKQELQPSTNKLQKKCDKDESGIFMDDTIIIDDSQETVIDKDEYAWLAVIEANKNDVTESTSIVNLDYSDVKSLNITSKQTKPISSTLQSNGNQIKRIPFYKKSYITETCTYCNNIAHKSDEPIKNVEITIDNQIFTTTIKVLKHVDNSSNLFSTSSVAVQTDMCDTTQMNDGLAVKERDNIKLLDCDDKSIGNTQSEDLFAEEAKYSVVDYKSNETRNCLVIEESDSDTDMEGSGPVPVKVDVHRSCDISEYGILGEVANIQEHDAMPRRGPRGLTPTSTDSSEKENFNPNRLKRQYSKKKKYAKK